MADDKIQQVRDELAKVADYHRRYNGGSEFRHEETIGRLASAIALLADEVEALRGDDDTVMGGGITPPFDPNDRSWEQ